MQNELNQIAPGGTPTNSQWMDAQIAAEGRGPVTAQELADFVASLSKRGLSLSVYRMESGTYEAIAYVN